jgi:hypothetical protein
MIEDNYNENRFTPQNNLPDLRGLIIAVLASWMLLGLSFGAGFIVARQRQAPCAVARPLVLHSYRQSF